MTGMTSTLSYNFSHTGALSQIPVCASNNMKESAMISSEYHMEF